MTTEWANFQNEMKNAVAADKHRVTQLNAKISAKVNTYCQRRVDVFPIICNQGEDINYQKSASIDIKLKTADASDPDSFTDSIRTSPPHF